MKINLKALTEKELKKFIEGQKQTLYRAKQIINWIYKKYATSFEEMTDLSKSFRELLNKTAFISSLKLLSRIIGTKDGTQKFLFELEDGETIESVLIPDKDRLTLCISSQVGCAMGCKFCVTGQLGLKRNLKAYEIIDQIISVSKIIAPSVIPPSPLYPALSQKCGVYQRGVRGDSSLSKITNIVFMGMGEPLHNFPEVLEALLRITDIVGFSKRRVTLSTVGIAPKIFELAEKAPRINLAISINATTDEIRNKIMPINQKYHLKELLNACRKFPLEPRRQITFEYLLLEGINDSKEDALRLINLLKGIKSKVNLIPYNPSPKRPEFRTTSKDKTIAFQKTLQNAGITAIIRKSKGGDIFAACGQLKATYFVRNSSTAFKSS
ncbi:MAG: 23S rRNA (adenine(2503)-C(2))-methyltransferase RlmN [Thermodesulfovibrionia bacterium]|nr:23S rRNA (adenine(2503)-C(2))-methyltransferase RlmN [Thermodesulfovibrionia bacterium]